MAGVEDGEEGGGETCVEADWPAVAVAAAGEDVAGEDTGVVNVGAGTEAAADAAGLASSVFTMLKTPVTRPPIIARTPPMAAACTVTFCALYHRATLIGPPPCLSGLNRRMQHSRA